MLARYVVADLARNPRRTLSTMIGICLGVGLFCSVLFFVDGLSASMTQRAVAPLAIDMQRIITPRSADSLAVTQSLEPLPPGSRDNGSLVVIKIRNTGGVSANEVTVRSRPKPGWTYLAGSARIDGVEPAARDNPFSTGPGRTGINLGTIDPGASHRLEYAVQNETTSTATTVDQVIDTTFSSRESLTPARANESARKPLATLAESISRIEGVSAAHPLLLADLAPGALSTRDVAPSVPAKVIGLDADYEHADPTVVIVKGKLTATGAVISAEAAVALKVGLQDTVTLTLPDSSTVDLRISGISDLSEARSLFSSRRGGDLETFIYSANSIIVSPETFVDTVQPAYERAASAPGARLKNPPLLEIDITLDRDLLNADPASALAQTSSIRAAIDNEAAGPDYMLDNISNTLTVAAADAKVAKRLFVFLGVPGGFLAAILSTYAGTVLAQAQRREQAILRIRGASRVHLLRMLALRTVLLAGIASLGGLMLGYGVATAVLGAESMGRASPPSLLISASVGTLGGFAATGSALYLAGRASINRDINEDRAIISSDAPRWRRSHLDLAGIMVAIVGTITAWRSGAFEGAAGSVYYGRGVELNLVLLILPLALWIAASLAAARILVLVLRRAIPKAGGRGDRAVPLLITSSVTRRAWAVAQGTAVVALIVALTTALAAFTSSYDAAKTDDARFANGSDIRVTPNPTASRAFSAEEAGVFAVDGIAEVTPVIFGVSNVVLRSARTSDPANLTAIDPTRFAVVAPIADDYFPSGDGSSTLKRLDDPSAMLLSTDMADFLHVDQGDTLDVLLARATDNQVETRLRIVGLFERLPGFPEGADAVMSIDSHTVTVPTKQPDFFLASLGGPSNADLDAVVKSLRESLGADGGLHIDTRATTLATDQSSLAALNIAGLLHIDTGFALAMAIVVIAIFVFGLLLQRRREYVTLRAQGLSAGWVRLLIAAEAATVALTGVVAGLAVGLTMGLYFVAILRPLFVLPPRYVLAVTETLTPVVLVLAATAITSYAGSVMISRLQPTELLRDD